MQQTVGDVLRTWRKRRHLSQLELATESNVSARHLSFIETGRAQASREMLVRLADGLDMPPRERNTLFVAGGYAPAHEARRFDDPELVHVRRAVELILRAHEPFPALAIDRHWNMVAANRALAPLLDGIVDTSLLQPPVNVLRLGLSPGGLASRVVNFAEWRAHLLERLHHEVAVSGDPVLEALATEVEALSHPGPARTTVPRIGAIVVPLVLDTAHGVLRFLSTTTVFGTAVDITVAELAIETFFPADETTAATIRKLASTGS